MKKSDFICPVDDCCECHTKDCWQDHTFCDDCEEEILKGEPQYWQEVDCRTLEGKWTKHDKHICEKCFMKQFEVEMETPSPSSQTARANQLNKIDRITNRV